MRVGQVRAVVLVIFVGGIAGMIVGSISDSNPVAITFGLVTAVAALCLILVTAVQQGPAVHFDERVAADLEGRIDDLVAGGADEEAVRDLVRRAVTLGRSGQP